MDGNSTEGMLREWRYGQAQAERLVAAMLHLEGFQDVDPQHPLGGPDGLKDVLCRRDSILWVAAAYFPTTRATFGQIHKKFVSDCAGVKANGAQGFAFFVNQHLTVGERKSLLSQSSAARTEIFHLERLCSLLNAPKGCGIRLEYLRIPMSEAEQWAFWSNMNSDIVRRLADNERAQEAERHAVNSKLDELLHRTHSILANQRKQLSSLNTGLAINDGFELPTAALSTALLCWLHRILTEDLNLPEAVCGQFRSVGVWVGPADASAGATFVPPPPERIPGLISEFIDWWNARHHELRGLRIADIVAGLAEFHHRFLAIHPFLDGNGRVARILLDQAARELLNQTVGRDFTADPADYYLALREADEGNFESLRRRIEVSLR